MEESRNLAHSGDSKRAQRGGGGFAWPANPSQVQNRVSGGGPFEVLFESLLGPLACVLPDVFVPAGRAPIRGFTVW